MEVNGKFYLETDILFPGGIAFLRKEMALKTFIVFGFVRGYIRKIL